jgi:hypothetical protein
MSLDLQAPLTPESQRANLALFLGRRTLR